MSLSYKDSNIIGGALDIDVIKQFETRQKVQGKQDRAQDSLNFLYSKTGWVKLSSSVNEGGSANLAKSNILFGGTLSKNGGLRSGLDQNPTPTQLGAYQKYNNTGFRPMAGITGVSVETQNIFGTLRQGVVDFVCWDVEQLEDLERLYLRPGFTALLEWGNSIYLDKKGRTVSEIQTVPFSQMTSKDQIYSRIATIRKESNYNYDGMFGFVKNFIFRLRNDGGYDCRVDLISIGSVLESIRIVIDPSTTTVDSTIESPIGTNLGAALGITNETLYKEKTAVHKFLTAIKKNTSPDEPILYPQPEARQSPAFTPFHEYKFTDEQKEFKELVKEDVGPFYDRFLSDVASSGQAFDVVVVEAKGKELEEGSKLSSTFRYISLGNLLVILNEAFMLKDQNNEKMVSFNTDIGKSTYLTFPPHLGIDPQVCILPKKIVGGSIQKLQYDMGSLPKPAGDLDDILNIYINVDYILASLDRLLTSTDESSKTIQDYIKSLLSGIQKNLGDINELDLYLEEEESKYYIVDRRVTPDDKSISLSKLNLTGLKSTVHSIDLSSKLTAGITTMVLIGAQAGNTDIGKDVLNLQRWNEGLEDRIIKVKKVTTIVKKDSLESQGPYLNYLNYIANTKTPGDRTVFKYNLENIDGISSIHQDLMVKLLKAYTKDRKKPTNPPGIIPISLTIILDGIAGIKIGQAFTINEGILPQKYNGVVGFIVTGLKNEIGSTNKWNTTITAQTIIVSTVFTDESVSLNRADLDSNLTAVEEQLGYNSDIPDPAPIINVGRIGAQSYSQSPLAKYLTSLKARNGFLPQDDPFYLVSTGITTEAASDYKADQGLPTFLLHPVPYQAFRLWTTEMTAAKIPWKLSDAYRNKAHQTDLARKSNLAASPGNSPHGWGGAVDFSNLFKFVKGSKLLQDALEGRKVSPDYKRMAEIGYKYGWVNPWRLSDNAGTGGDEIWHFEWWGNPYTLSNTL